VRYELSGAPLTSYACHCQGCQRGAGSAYTLSLIVRRGDLRVIEGALAEGAFELPSGERRWHGCARCCTPLWYSSPKVAGLVAIKSGTLDDPARFPPVAHLWTRHAHAHVVLPEGVATYAEQTESWQPLLELWESRDRA
jgi:hypothetical protein